MKLLFRCEFGSKVYGTTLPSSDKDYKSVYIGTPEEILLARTKKVLKNDTKKDDKIKNTSEDIDDETFSLQEYLRLLLEGQTPALDMLFCPKELILTTSRTWEIIQENKQFFLHKGVSSFVNYTRAQAAKYGVKGFRVAAMKEILTFLQTLPEVSRTLGYYANQLGDFMSNCDNEHINVVKGDDGIIYLEVCGRKYAYHSKISYLKDACQKIYDNYGHRAKLAETNDDQDHKALYHAVRVAREAEELLLTGHITFPRPEKDLLLQIRKGELPYAEVEKIIEDGLVRIGAAQLASKLPDSPDFKKADEIVMNAHMAEVLEWWNK